MTDEKIADWVEETPELLEDTEKPEETFETPADAVEEGVR